MGSAVAQIAVMLQIAAREQRYAIAVPKAGPSVPFGFAKELSTTALIAGGARLCKGVALYGVWKALLKIGKRCARCSDPPSRAQCQDLQRSTFCCELPITGAMS